MTRQQASEILVAVSAGVDKARAALLTAPDDADTDALLNGALEELATALKLAASIESGVR